ncbi:Uncharacterised protein [Neisseria meningitidis]|nr:Uncharacterised protein [Neisseria meningitidis]
MPSAVTMTSTNDSIPATWRIKASVASLERVSLYSAKIGTNAWANAPSANTRRSRLGSLNATKNASVAMPAPNARAMTVSRTNPKTRDTIVRLPTFTKAPSIFIVFPFRLKPRPLGRQDQTLIVD